MAEISGLAWHADRLIFLPQYPDRFPGGSNGSLFFLDKTEILAFIDGENADPLEPHPIPFNLFAVQEQIKGYEGFESIAFVDDTAYLTIEASPFGMMGYLTSATMAADGSSLTLDLARLGQIPPQTAMPNLTNEALLVLGRRILTFYEANGQRINQDPVAQLFDTQMQQQDTITLPNIEYRLTDATPPDEFGRFWVINIYNPREILLLPGPDSLSEEFGKGRSHSQSTTVERLVELQISESGIIFSDTPPIQLELSDDNKPRNWEGIARLDDRGFLIVTDRVPGTILAFVPFP